LQTATRPWPRRPRRGRSGLEGNERKLRFVERQPRLGAQAGVPARRRRLEPPRLLVERQQQQRQGVRERDLRELRRHRPGQQEVPPFESAFELLYALRCEVTNVCSHDHERQKST
jgi:hypothetical protein